MSLSDSILNQRVQESYDRINSFTPDIPSVFASDMGRYNMIANAEDISDSAKFGFFSPNIAQKLLKYSVVILKCAGIAGRVEEIVPGSLSWDLDPVYEDTPLSDYRVQFDHDLAHVFSNLGELVAGIYSADKGFMDGFARMFDEPIVSRVVKFPAYFAVELLMHHAVAPVSENDIDIGAISTDVSSLAQGRLFHNFGLVPIVGPDDIPGGGKIIIDDKLKYLPCGSQSMFLSILYNLTNNAAKKFNDDFWRHGSDAMPYVPMMSIETREIRDAYYLSVADSGGGVSLDSIMRKVGLMIKEGRDIVGIDQNLRQNLVNYLDNPLHMYLISAGDLASLCMIQGLTGIGDERVETGRSSKGTGFGLFGVRRFVEQLGGKLYAPHVYGANQHFILVLPKDNKRLPGLNRTVKHCPLPYHILKVA